MWGEGQSASQIAKELGGVTRNAVIGKVHRLGLSNRAGSAKPAAKEKPAAKTAAKAKPAAKDRRQSETRTRNAIRDFPRRCPRARLSSRRANPCRRSRPRTKSALRALRLRP